MGKFVFVLSAVLAFIVSASMVVADDVSVANGPAEIVIDAAQAKFPPVKFNHAEHQSRAGDCTTCHHKNVDGEAASSCASCHGKADGAPSYKDAMHKNCQGCHKKEGGNAPTKCNGCHVK
ncbi:MAG: cytochrome c3 family protein [bacterium]|nr:cytochrome c3 family protein [bacterium]